ncbi:TIM-barrel domain-containing protein [Jiella sonneratiae]|uniref:Glycoside hydrolase family 31 protein n=1 Tax=Jiella sonneratiae TaxID=2816856 RepID=A0ABS3IZL4_9HYPH|nr:TIM-barrel domain-containing protein [Jiella sonneratiae]MBO0902864.1 glycoside hydrolase family 31 protein [Jiella sonneratiae]
MTILRASGPAQETRCGLKLPLNLGFTLTVEALGDGLTRIAVVPEGGLAVDRTWMIAPDGDTPWEGRDRLSVEGFAPPGVVHETADGIATLTAGDTRIRVEPAPLRLTVQRRDGEGWRTLLKDRERSAYDFLEKRGVLRHYQTRPAADRHFGLGDKTGPLDRTGRRFRVLQIDSMGYDAELTDPLYKHAPFVIVEGADGTATGLLYDTMAEMAVDLGAEHSNYYEPYRHVEILEKGLVLYVLDGPRIADVVPRLMRLTGRPHLPPRWSMGFAFTTMHHADAPDAQAVMTNFAERCRRDDIPISAIHSGSGYTTRADGRRYVFTWNETKFPDRKAFFARLKELGYHSCANVKPVLLKEHPAYPEAAARGLFVKRQDGGPAVEMFWGGEGSSLDLSNPAAVAWWQAGIAEKVLGEGFDAAWNDNNEAELWDETASVDGFGRPLPAIDAKPLQALLMTRATFEATRDRDPDRRPYTISRAGPIGIARYGETWTGDNYTSFHTLKWNIRNGLSMSLSGMPFIGHDIGGFAGPKPGPELFTRFVQLMALHPRAVMNSWKPQLAEPVNLPWMHPEATENVKAALRLRYRFLPLIYSLAHHCHQAGEPIVAPLFYHFADAACRNDPDAFMLGPDVLVAPNVTEGAATVSVDLPAVAGGWHDYWSETMHPGGSHVTVAAPLDRLPIFVRSGAVLPLAFDWPATSPHEAKAVALTAFAAPADAASTSRRTIFFDDGESWRYRDGDCSRLACDLACDDARVRLTVTEEATGRGRPDLFVEIRGIAERSAEHSLP